MNMVIVLLGYRVIDSDRTDRNFLASRTDLGSTAARAVFSRSGSDNGASGKIGVT